MARIRYIKPEFFDSEQVASVSLAARLLFAGLWTVADREGRFELAPRRIKARLFPYDSLDVEPLLTELLTAKLLVAYQVAGTLYGWMPGFVKHQRPHPNEAKSTFPACPPDGALDPNSWNVTSRNDGLRQSRGEGNGEGTEGEGTGRALVLQQPKARRASFPDPQGFRLDPTAAAHIVVGEGQLVSVPGTWAQKACREYGLTLVDIDAFAVWAKGWVAQHGFEDGGKRLPWLDARLAEWRATRRAVSATNADVQRTDALLAEQALRRANAAPVADVLEGLRVGRATR